MPSRKEIHRGVRNLAEVLASDFREVDGCIYISHPGKYLHDMWHGDPVAMENHVNALHIEDLLWPLLRDSVGEDRRVLRILGRSIARVWARELQPLLGSRRALIYLGGRDTVVIRFHLIREGYSNLIDLDDSAYLRRNRMEVYEVTSEGFARVGDRS